MSKEPTESITVRLPRSLVKRMDEHARKTFRNRTGVVRLALDAITETTSEQELEPATDEAAS